MLKLILNRFLFHANDFFLQESIVCVVPLTLLLTGPTSFDMEFIWTLCLAWFISLEIADSENHRRGHDNFAALCIEDFLEFGCVSESNCGCWRILVELTWLGYQNSSAPRIAKFKSWYIFILCLSVMRCWKSGMTSKTNISLLPLNGPENVVDLTFLLYV